MIYALIDYLKGYVILKVYGKDIERFLNIARRRGIVLFDISYKGGLLVVKARPKDFFKIREIVKKTKVKVRVSLKTGFPFLFFRLKKRKALLGGVILLALCFYLSSLFVWRIEIVPSENFDVNETEVREYLEKLGVKEGVLKKNINTDLITKRMLVEWEDFSWVFSKIKGMRLIISLAERKEPPEIIKEDYFCNIVAKADGYVKKIVVKNGTANVQVGDTVRKGDVLINGYIEYKDETIEPARAQGDVFARTYVSDKAKINLVETKRVNTGNVYSRYYINFRGGKIFFNKIDQYPKDYDKIDKVLFVKTIRGKKLPLGLNVEKYIEKKTLQTRLDIDTATRLASQKASLGARQKISSDAIISSKNEFLIRKDDELYVEVMFESIENIGLEVHFDEF